MNETQADIVKSLIILHGDAFLTDMQAWFQHPVNWLVWSAFVYQANLIWDTGRKHYSARTIVEVLRHHSALKDSSADFKINDHTTPDLARLYMLMHPEREGFFEFRGRRAA